MWNRGGRRIFDFVIALALLVLFSPILIVLAIWILLSAGPPALFRQARGGYRGKVFEVRKFRTMLDRRDPSGKLLPDEQRLTSVGRVLRATSLDELPTLWNVVRGEMSLVGPRPLMAKYLDLYSEEQMRRHDVLPGITGWAQVKGRNALEWEQKFAFDLWYVDHAGFRLDMKILWFTIWKTLRREGIGYGATETMPEFTGSIPAGRKEK